MVIGILVGIFVGTAIAVRKDKLSDHAARAISLLRGIHPHFLARLLLLNVFYSIWVCSLRVASTAIII